MAARKHIPMEPGYHSWTRIESTHIVEKNGNRSVSSLCRCVCGTEKVIRDSALRSGKSKSCGCQWKTTLPIGEPFGRWKVLSASDSIVDKNGIANSASLCRCKCGTERIVKNYTLLSKHNQSCGCVAKEKAFALGKSKATHGHSRVGQMSLTYCSWASMMTRCTNANSTKYSDYGGRGIQVCEQWHLFENFLADMGDRPSKQHSIDRFPDTNGHYEKDNCRWATPHEQARNRRNTIMVTFDGMTCSLHEMCERKNLPFLTMRSRKRLGWDDDRIFTTPINHRMAR